jgi:hypothetical protein
MCPVIDNPARCEIHAVICFLHAKNVSAAKTHRELYAVYGQNVMSEGTVRQWYKMFKDEEQRGLPAIWFKVLTKKFVEDGTSQFQKCCVNFHKLRARWILKMVTGAHKMQRTGF